MAVDNTPPRIKLIATIAVITVITLIAINFVTESYYAMMTDQAQREKLAPTRDKEDLHKAEALAWLGLLDSVGLGGCLALDMGLGKTPTMLAHLLAGKGEGPSLVIAPPAVVGNWAAEAARFVPELRVGVHHGANRVSIDQVEDEVSRAGTVRAKKEREPKERSGALSRSGRPVAAAWVGRSPAPGPMTWRRTGRPIDR